jgi:hypothetical protein
MPRGGHFAAWSEPELMLADLRAFVATVVEEPPRQRGRSVQQLGSI